MPATLAWLERLPLLDPETLTGALVLALLVALGTGLLSLLAGRVITRSTWLMQRLVHDRVDETMLRYAIRVKSVLVWLAGAAFYASLVPALRALLGTVVASAGITAVVMGFAAKSTLANLISGMTLAFYRPIRIGDKVSLEGEFGVIEDITLRHTIVRTWEGKRLIIPNEKIDNMSLVNYSIVDNRALLALELGIGYDSDLDLAKAIVLEEVAKNPDVLPADQAPGAPGVRLVEWGDSALKLRATVWVADMDAYYKAKSELLESIKKRFDAAGIEIPFPHRVIVRKDAGQA